MATAVTVSRLPTDEPMCCCTCTTTFWDAGQRLYGFRHQGPNAPRSRRCSSAPTGSDRTVALAVLATHPVDQLARILAEDDLNSPLRGTRRRQEDRPAAAGGAASPRWSSPYWRTARPSTCRPTVPAIGGGILRVQRRPRRRSRSAGQPRLLVRRDPAKPSPVCPPRSTRRRGRLRSAAEAGPTHPGQRLTRPGGDRRRCPATKCSTRTRTPRSGSSIVSTRVLDGVSDHDRRVPLRS